MAIPLLIILFITRQRTLETKLGLVFLTLFLLTTQAFTLSWSLLDFCCMGFFAWNSPCC
ncbi:MAG: hypothetical protein H8D87_04345 [Deltaproteobacteria bacterium]|uniref:hypothetical protein n=1 Tax=Desulfobacula sp. TaxID=2593537 RepID=UPI0019B2159F|nr:hypothetical protein [Candidatus Desulfobacula maris]MBL6992366.1 hypothetical protein [Desulfobacula sp.]